MEIIKTLEQIESSLSRWIENYAKDEELLMEVQLETYESDNPNFVYDVAVLLYDSEGMVLGDETYIEGSNNISTALNQARELYDVCIKTSRGLNVNVGNEFNLIKYKCRYNFN